MADKRSIISTDMGRRMLSMISPIYEKSYVGLWLMEVIGREWNDLRLCVDSMRKQITPRAATWSLPFWEEEYGLAIDPSSSDAHRRAKLISRMQSYGAFTPYKVRSMAEAMTGAIARVVEEESPYAFTLYLSMETRQDENLARDLMRAKPAHIHCEICYEDAAVGAVYVGCAIARFLTIEIRQAN